MSNPKSRKQTEEDKLKRLLFRELHLNMSALMFEMPDKVYKVEIGCYSGYLSMSVGARTEETENYPWVHFHELDSAESLEEKAKVIRAFANGEISVIPENCR